MKLPRLKKVKFNKRAGKETPVLRIYTTKKGKKMFFMMTGSVYLHALEPYYSWSQCGYGHCTLQRFHARICGIGE